MIRQLLLFFLFTQFCYGQDILVPYRIGTQFGLSNLKGEIVLPPAYDEILYDRSSPRGFFPAVKDNKHFLLQGSKEIIKNSELNSFQVIDPYVVIGRKTKNSFDYYPYTDKKVDENEKQYYALYSMSGDTIYPGNFKSVSFLDSFGISESNKNLSKYLAFVSVDFTNKKGLFVYDCMKHTISEWLLKDAIELGAFFKFGVKDKGGIYFKIKKTESNQLEEMYLIFENQHFSLGNYSDKTRIENEIYQKQLNDESYARSFPLVEQPYVNDYDDYYTKLNKYTRSEFYVNEGHVFNKQTKKNLGTTTKEIVYLEKADKFFILKNTKIIVDEKRIAAHNCIYFIIHNKHGLYITDSLFIEPLYDTIKPIESNGKQSFLVGIMDKTTSKMKYGTIDIKGNYIIPLIFDKIDVNSKAINSIRNVTDQTHLLVEKDKKVGLITTSYAVILEPVYDSIFRNPGFNGDKPNNFLTLKKDGLYGMYIGARYLKETIQPVYPERPVWYWNDYQKEENLLIIAIGDPDGKFLGYANKNGLLYYRK